jgi:hypothetical protein
MSDGAVYVARCFECGWESPHCETEGSATYWVGWHAIYDGCPINTVRSIRTSEVSA